VIVLRRAVPGDAPGIADVHIASWRTTYPGILPDHVLTELSPSGLTRFYERVIRFGSIVHVAVDHLAGATEASESGPRVIGFVTARRTRVGMADGEIETLYVLDDYRDRGFGRMLIRAAAGDLAADGGKSLLVWVLTENPSRWFYARLGARHVADDTIEVGGVPTQRSAFVWDRIDALVG